MKAKELRDLSTDELRSKQVQLKEELFNLRFQLATNNLDNPSRIRQVKRDIARCHTLMRERDLRAQAQ